MEFLRSRRWGETRASDVRRFVGEAAAFFGLAFFGSDFTARRRVDFAAAALPLRRGLVVDAAFFAPAPVFAFGLVFAAAFLAGSRFVALTAFPVVRLGEEAREDFDFRAVDFEEEDARDDFILLQYRTGKRSSLSALRTLSPRAAALETRATDPVRKASHSYDSH